MLNLKIWTFWKWSSLFFLFHHITVTNCSQNIDDFGFSSHRLISPKLYSAPHHHEIGRFKRHIVQNTKKQITSTLNLNGLGHIDSFRLELELDAQNHILDLHLNKDLLPKNYFERTQSDEDFLQPVIHKPTYEEVNLCHYYGKIRGHDSSWAALSTCLGLRGIIFDGKEFHYLEPFLISNHNNKTESGNFAKLVQNESGWETFHFKDTHRVGLQLNNTGQNLVLEKSSLNAIKNYSKSQFPKLTSKSNRMKRNVGSSYHEPYNSNSESRYVEMVIVVDNTKYREMESDRKKVSHRVKEIANIVNALYNPLNIFIGLSGIVIWDKKDEIEISSKGDEALSSFLLYRRERLLKDHPNDNAQLITGKEFGDSVVGKAMQGPLCSYKFSGGVNSDYKSVVGVVATTVSHELGHNFGLSHDTDSCSCDGPDNKCIMYASSSSNRTAHWSSCSKESMKFAMEHGMDYCLRNKPNSLFDGPTCGNGFTEEGEECDCGHPEHCKNYCCNPHTCKLYSNATCAAGTCCDTSICDYKSGGTVCRPEGSVCDLAEYCNGESEFCPPDVYKINGMTCNSTNGTAYCYEGECKSHSAQCQILWGKTGTVSGDVCYQKNVNGSRYGHCGHSLVTGNYTPCARKDIKCGVLQCEHQQEKLEFGYESISQLSAFFINVGGKIHPCRSVTTDFGLSVRDPGLVPNGAKCGDNKMCVNEKCVEVSGNLSPYLCPNNCSGNGVCNSKGNCHCWKGHGGSSCESGGFGGSVDSGPIVNPFGECLRRVVSCLGCTREPGCSWGEVVGVGQCFGESEDHRHVWDVLVTGGGWRSCPIVSSSPLSTTFAPPVRISLEEVDNEEELLVVFRSHVFARALYVTFLGFIPLIAIIVFYLYHASDNITKFFKRPPMRVRPPPNERDKPDGSNGSPPNNKNSSQANKTDAKTNGDLFGQYKGFSLSPIKTGENLSNLPVVSQIQKTELPPLPNGISSNILLSNSSIMTKPGKNYENIEHFSNDETSGGREGNNGEKIGFLNRNIRWREPLSSTAPISPDGDETGSNTSDTPLTNEHKNEKGLKNLDKGYKNSDKAKKTRPLSSPDPINESKNFNTSGSEKKNLFGSNTTISRIRAALLNFSEGSSGGSERGKNLGGSLQRQRSFNRDSIQISRPILQNIEQTESSGDTQSPMGSTSIYENTQNFEPKKSPRLSLRNKSPAPSPPIPSQNIPQVKKVQRAQSMVSYNSLRKNRPTAPPPKPPSQPPNKIEQIENIEKITQKYDTNVSSTAPPNLPGLHKPNFKNQTHSTESPGTNFGLNRPVVKNTSNGSERSPNASNAKSSIFGLARRDVKNEANSSEQGPNASNANSSIFGLSSRVSKNESKDSEPGPNASNANSSIFGLSSRVSKNESQGSDTGPNASNANELSLAGLNRRFLAPIAKLDENELGLSESGSPSPSSKNNENIYDVIEEGDESGSRGETVSTGSSDGGNGLLNDIISEIESRNRESIYNSVDRRKKKRENLSVLSSKEKEKVILENPIIDGLKTSTLPPDKIYKKEESGPKTISNISKNSEGTKESPRITVNPIQLKNNSTPSTTTLPSSTQKVQSSSVLGLGAIKKLPPEVPTKPTCAVNGIPKSPDTLTNSPAVTTNIGTHRALLTPTPTPAPPPILTPSYVAKINYFSPPHPMKPVSSLTLALAEGQATQSKDDEVIYAPGQLSTIRPTWSRKSAKGSGGEVMSKPVLPPQVPHLGGGSREGSRSNSPCRTDKTTELYGDGRAKGSGSTTSSVEEIQRPEGYKSFTPYLNRPLSFSTFRPPSAGTSSPSRLLKSTN